MMLYRISSYMVEYQVGESNCMYVKFRISPTYLSQLIQNQKMLNSFITRRPTDRSVKGVLAPTGISRVSRQV
jgi:hypothetical protein